MSEKPRRPSLTVPIFRPRDDDHMQLLRAREVIDFAKKILAESDPSVLLGRDARSPSKENE
jgi:hypothetical protein